MSVRSFARRALYHTGLLDAWHRAVNRNTLTVVLFHRVLADDSPEWTNADPDFSHSATLFRDCLRFFARRYNIVSLDDVLASRIAGQQLPPYALLITFDDGWADNKLVALPILRRFDIPGALFVAMEPLESEETSWWQETVAVALRHGQTGAITEALRRQNQNQKGKSEIAARSPILFLNLLCQLSELGAEERDQLIEQSLNLKPKINSERQMLRPDDLLELRQNGLTIACHGAAHVPMTALADAALVKDLKTSRERLAYYLNGDVTASRCLAFPHGRYNGRTVAIARHAGFDLLFTTDPYLNRLDRTDRCQDLLARMCFSASQVTNDAGKFAPDRLAKLIFTAPKRSQLVQADEEL